VTRGARHCRLQSRRLAACAPRRLCTRMSSTIPPWPTARRNQCRTPAMVSPASFKRHLLPAPDSLQRIGFATPSLTLSAYWRTVSWLTAGPRTASGPSTMRKPSGKRDDTAWLMLSGEKRQPASLGQAGVAIPSAYPEKFMRVGGHSTSP